MPGKTTDTSRHVDILVIGAGLSGIGAACHIRRNLPGKTFTVLERRDAIGGTWDLFRYPGVRSDSDMYTLGYNFRPWRGTKVLADGPSIKQYIQDTADENDVTPHIRFERKVIRSGWSSEQKLWTTIAVDQVTGAEEIYTSRFLVGTTGYYNHDTGHRPTFPGEERFAGLIVHPQHWPTDLDHAGKRVVVVGSGATAITLVPAMAETAAHVTMLQRSPTYVLSVPESDPLAAVLQKLRVPATLIYRLGRARNIALQRLVYDAARKQPRMVRALIERQVAMQVGPTVERHHFSPHYNPWDERLCVVPNGDLFKALRRGTASVVTAPIETFTESGLRLASGEEIPADIVVTATGLEIQLAGGAELDVDGAPLTTHDRVIYKGVLLDGVPNALFVLGYTNASWTLKADLASEYFCRLLKHMDAHGHTMVVADADPEDKSQDSAMGSALKSGYIQRADGVMPRQGTRKPWKVLDNYYKDVFTLRRGAIADPALRFSDDAAAEPPASRLVERTS